MVAKSLEKVEHCACTLHDGKGQEKQKFVRPKGQNQGLAGHVISKMCLRLSTMLWPKNGQLHSLHWLHGTSKEEWWSHHKSSAGFYALEHPSQEHVILSPRASEPPRYPAQTMTPPRSSGKKPGLLDKTLP